MKVKPLIDIHAQDGRFRFQNKDCAKAVVEKIKESRNTLQQVDYVHHRKTDRKPEHQDGSGAIFWVAVAALCWIVIICLCAYAGYFD